MKETNKSRQREREKTSNMYNYQYCILQFIKLFRALNKFMKTNKKCHEFHALYKLRSQMPQEIKFLLQHFYFDKD